MELAKVKLLKLLIYCINIIIIFVGHIIYGTPVLNKYTNSHYIQILFIMKKLFLFFSLLCFVTTAATAAPVIVKGTLVSWTDAAGDIVIPDEVTAIGANVFNSNTKITSVSGGANVVSLGDYAFKSCALLTTVSFPLATTIGIEAFYFCISLTTASFPMATSIGNVAFYYCSSLTTVSFPLATTIGYWDFYDCTSLTTVSFPLATEIGYSAFWNCSSLINVSFPMATSIRDMAFYYCSSLTTASFPLATRIGNEVFHSCSSLTIVSFLLATSIESAAFSGCSNLTNISIPKVTRVSYSVFENCTALKSIDLPKTTSIVDHAFRNCYQLGTVNLPEIQTIGKGAFENCISLETVDCSMSQQLTTVDPTAFPVDNSDLTILVYDDLKVALFPVNREYKVISANNHSFVSSPEASTLMNIYPNPGANIVNVELSDELRAKQLVVTDMSGKAVMIESVMQQSMKLDVSKLAAGVYLIKAGDVSRQLIVGK